MFSGDRSDHVRIRTREVLVRQLPDASEGFLLWRAVRLCNGGHFRLTSLVPHDVWYDGDGRLVRQEWTEDGHKTVLELAGKK